MACHSWSGLEASAQFINPHVDRQFDYNHKSLILRQELYVLKRQELHDDKFDLLLLMLKYKRLITFK
jgi:hypothetical protein